MIKIAASILSADFADFARDVRAAEAAGADIIHCDVMDGHFVPNLTFGADTVMALRRHTSLPLDVHLMIGNPGAHIRRFHDAGANLLTIHYEACGDPAALLDEIRALGMKAGLSIKPDTRAESIFPLLPYCDMVLIMTVEPGFGGQTFLYPMLEKIRSVKAAADERGLNIDIEVDGGVNRETAREVISAGANILVAGHSVYAADDMRKSILEMKGEL